MGNLAGGNAGCGRETVKALLSHDAKVYLAARNEDKARKAIEELKDETGKEAVFLQLDLADLASVKSSTNQFLSIVRLSLRRQGLYSVSSLTEIGT